MKTLGESMGDETRSLRRLEKCSTKNPAAERKIKKESKRKREEDVSLTKAKKEDEEIVGITKAKKKKLQAGVNKGDILNLSDLLFTKERDFLVKYNHRQQLVKVKAEQLAGKVIVLYFASVVRRHSLLRKDEAFLSDIYRELHPRGLFEVVFVALGDPPFKHFRQKFSRMPWTAIPFSDSISRKRLGSTFCISTNYVLPSAFVIDPKGTVLQCQGFHCFDHGPEAFPFTDESIDRLISRLDAIIDNPSLKKLLLSPQRDYLINNKNVQVPVRDLRNKVVALYLYEHGCNTELTAKLKEAYEELVLKNKKNFEVVLVYISHSLQTYHTTEETFWKAFETMPWLAIPFKDPNCIKLQRMFDYPLELCDSNPNPALVIIGRNGNFIEPFGADILMKFGCRAYPFTTERAAQLVAKKASKLKLEMFWGPNTVFKRKSGPAEGGSQVQISQLVGKNIIVLFEDYWLKLYPLPMKMLGERYMQMKGTDNEFEVIQVFYSKRRYSYYKHGASLPWLMCPCFKMGCDVKKVLYSVFPAAADIELLAFDKEGTVVRIASNPTFEKDTVFPFYNGDMQKEVLMELRSDYNWDYLSDDDVEE